MTRHRLRLLLIALAAVACSPDRLLNVRDIDVLDPSTLNTKEALPTLLAGSLSAFQIAYSGGGDLSNGGHEGMVNLSGLLADEYIHAETFPDRQGVDVRSIAPGNGSVKGVFFDLSQARAFADLASSRYNTFDPGTEGHSEALSLSAYSYLLFAEDFCSGVPFSTLTDAGIDYGQPHARGRNVTGALAGDLGNVWRLGANEATTLRSDVDLVIGTLTVPKGAYTLAAETSATGPWKLIVNSKTGQWGIPYDASTELGRTALTSRTLATPIESFTMWLIPSPDGSASGEIRFAWGTREFSATWRVK